MTRLTRLLGYIYAVLMAPESAEEKRVRGILIAMAAVGSAFVIMLGTGFRVTNEPANPIGDGLYYGAIIVLAAIVVFAVWQGVFSRFMDTLRGGRLGPIDRMRINAKERARHEARQSRLHALAADPLRRKYADLIQSGEDWSDEQIEYDLDPAKLATCEHLNPIEQAMRDEGIEVRLDDGAHVRANCRVDPVAVRERFSPPPFVEYSTPTPVGRALQHQLPAMLTCTQDGSIIRVIHRLDATPETPVFPAGADADRAGATAAGSELFDRYAEVRVRIRSLARVIDAPVTELPTFEVSEQNGVPHIEIQGDTFHYVKCDRGQEFDRFTTRSIDDLLYRVFRDIAFYMAIRLASSYYKPGEDERREMFRQQLLLLGRLDPEWEARCHLEHLEVLASHPFVDAAR